MAASAGGWQAAGLTASDGLLELLAISGRVRGGVDDLDTDSEDDAGGGDADLHHGLVQGAVAGAGGDPVAGGPALAGDAAGGGQAGPGAAGDADDVGMMGPAGAPNVFPDGAAGPALPGPAEDFEPQARRQRRAPKAGTGEWFRVHRAEPILPGHAVTIVEACHWLASLKSSSRMTDDALDKVCLMVSKFLLPPGNLFPTSYHMVKATLGVENSKACTDHICDKCWSVFPKLREEDFAEHANDVCQASGLPGCVGGVCGNARFETSEVGTVLPKRSFYQFSVEETVRDLLEVTLGNWDQVHAQRRADFQQAATFWGSPAGRQLDAACGHKFSNPPDGEIAVNFALGALLVCRGKHHCVCLSGV